MKSAISKLRAKPDIAQKLRKIIFFIAVIVIGIGVVSYLKLTQKTLKPRSQVITPSLVNVIPAQLGTFSPHQRLYGKLNNERLVKILAHGHGEIKKVLVSGGDQVRQGELLIQLDDTDFRTNFEAKQTQVEQTELAIDQAIIDMANAKKLLSYEQNLLQIDKKRLERAKKLSIQQNISNTALENAQERFIQRQSAVAQQEKKQQDSQIHLKRLQSRLKSEKSQLVQATDQLQRTLTKAPIAGLVTAVNTQKGSRVGINAEMLAILPLENLEVTAVLVNSHLPIILDALQQQQVIYAQVTVFGSSITATFSRLQGQSNNGAAVGIFTLQNPTLDLLQKLRPNHLLPLLVQLPMVENALKIPFTALYGSDKIYVVREGRLHALTVQLLGATSGVDSQEDWALIQSDEIQPNDVIAVTNLPNATHDLPVSIKP